jgi:hypothetical protein
MGAGSMGSADGTCICTCMGRVRHKHGEQAAGAWGAGGWCMERVRHKHGEGTARAEGADGACMHGGESGQCSGGAGGTSVERKRYRGGAQAVHAHGECKRCMHAYAATTPPMHMHMHGGRRQAVQTHAAWGSCT